ncbi:MAG: hypothetical protein FWH27_13260, partial [Planctomycetaceae bacterium]|nr:hypothetical protein [Planctomycetaceae bacterium]
ELFMITDDGEEWIGSFASDENGIVSFEIAAAGSYVIREVLPLGWKAVDPLYFSVDEEGVLSWEGDCSFVNEAIIYGGDDPGKELWMGVHLSTSGIGTTTVTMQGDTQYVIPGAGWGFTYVKLVGLSLTNPLTFDIIGNKVVYGQAVVSLDADLNIVLTISGITISSGNETVKVELSNDPADMIKHGDYSYKVSNPVQNENGSYTFVISFDVSPFAVN